jgi:hypothetical protein
VEQIISGVKKGATELVLLAIQTLFHGNTTINEVIDMDNRSCRQFNASGRWC